MERRVRLGSGDITWQSMQAVVSLLALLKALAHELALAERHPPLKQGTHGDGVTCSVIDTRHDCTIATQSHAMRGHASHHRTIDTQ